MPGLEQYFPSCRTVEAVSECGSIGILYAHCLIAKIRHETMVATQVVSSDAVEVSHVVLERGPFEICDETVVTEELFSIFQD